VAERLEAVAKAKTIDLAGMREALSPADPWLAQFKASPGLSAPKAENAPPPPSVPDYSKNHRLTMVLLLGDGGTAIVNGKAVRVGDELDGYKLVGITAGSATFVSGNDRAELKLNPETEKR
jgi:hypothetical protein